VSDVLNSIRFSVYRLPQIDGAAGDEDDVCQAPVLMLDLPRYLTVFQINSEVPISFVKN
jgi:hypothetical protein